ncbi:hypothetical protein EXU48_08605 [Occultella glacieicola]|uniref:Uncharacterized protein n=1 Tax=Occultella glacieicola TaxID=2518684 RepID=A0ABY2E497_9MICO|nr:hypothetical protein [Occultella glacieicola]TDE94844.1 hypothetical protein EXU48_08605 [Occultella glacieicola]
MNAATRGLILTAMISGALIVAAVLLWVLEVIGLPVFLGAVVVISIAQMGVTMRMLGNARRDPRGGSSASGGTAPGDGFDPMDKYR